jgi:hypothetical protein
MALSTGPRKAPDGSKNGWSWADGVSWALAGLAFGIGVTLQWQAFHSPFVFWMLAAVAGSILTTRLAPLKPLPVDKSPYRQ